MTAVGAQLAVHLQFRVSSSKFRVGEPRDPQWELGFVLVLSEAVLVIVIEFSPARRTEGGLS